MNIIQKKELLRLWKQKIESAPTRRLEIKNELLKLTTLEKNDDIQKKYTAFLNRRRALLNENHGQGFTWEPHLQWLWGWFSFFLPAAWKPFPGSKMRQALEEEPTISSFKVLDEDAPIPELTQTEEKNTSQHNFEDALLNNPGIALIDLNHELDQLSETTSQEALPPLFERLALIKTYVDPLVYYQLLEKLYKHQPLNALRHFYNLYQNDDKDMPNGHDFIEQHLWVKTVLDTFVKNSETTVYNVQILLIFLSAVPPAEIPQSLLPYLLSGEKGQPIDFFNELFELWADKPEDALGLLSTVYGKHRSNLQKQIRARLDSNTLQSRRLNNQFSVTKGDGASYIKMLEDIHEYIKPAKHPLLKHLARQAAEQLLAIYYQTEDAEKEPIWREQHEGAETFRLIGKLLDKPPIVPSKYKTYVNGLDPLSHAMDIIPASPYDFKHAERCAVEIILGAVLSTEMAIINARHIRQTYSQFKNPSPFLISWILKRVKPFNPDAIAGLTYALRDLTIYSPDDLPSHEITDFPHKPAELEKLIEEQLITLALASKKRQANEEKQASATLLNQLVQLINHPDIDPEMLNKAQNLLEKFKDYLTLALKAALENTIQQRQTDLCKWEKSRLGAFDTREEKLDLDNVSTLKLKALTAGYQRQFLQQYLQSQKAVNVFAVVLERLDKKDIRVLRHAQAVLEDLQVYLTDNQYQEWQKQISKLIHDCPLSEMSLPLSKNRHYWLGGPAKVSTLPSDEQVEGQYKP